MGCVQTHSNGIVDYGQKVRLTCEICNNTFVGYINVVTIKGPSPNPIICSICGNIVSKGN